ncbi:hypothetical protein FPV67DRAFT_178419 [Lyophyllum atratum]|nr:hypothetical protein FPV67DRAFT_178419 [Lyophyllum atratum]
MNCFDLHHVTASHPTAHTLSPPRCAAVTHLTASSPQLLRDLIYFHLISPVSHLNNPALLPSNACRITSKRPNEGAEGPTSACRAPRCRGRCESLTFVGTCYFRKGPCVFRVGRRALEVACVLHPGNHLTRLSRSRALPCPPSPHTLASNTDVAHSNSYNNQASSSPGDEHRAPLESHSARHSINSTFPRRELDSGLGHHQAI